MEQRPATNCVFVKNAEFGKLIGNRDLNANHIARIKNAIKNGTQMPAIRATSDEKHYIIDGQHRYEAYRQLWEEGNDYWMLVEFYDSKNPFMDAINFNNTQIKWSLSTYIFAYIKRESPEYVKLKNFVDNTVNIIRPNGVIPWDVYLALFEQSPAKVKKGELEITESKIKWVNKIIQTFKNVPFIFSRKEAIKGLYSVLRTSELKLEQIRDAGLQLIEERPSDIPYYGQGCKWEEFYKDICEDDYFEYL